MSLEVVILAAGNSTRMKSKVPKVLHRLGGEPLLDHVLRQAESMSPDSIHVVVSESNKDLLKSTFSSKNLHWVVQTEQLGSGHAVLHALPNIKATSTVLVLYGDVPRLKTATLQQCIASGTAALTILTANVTDPTGYGRILRDEDDRVDRIVEDRDLQPSQRSVNEINSGIMCGPSEVFRTLLPLIKQDNDQNEIYLTDIVGLARSSKLTVESVTAGDETEIQGVNSRKQLAELERMVQREIAEQLMDSGVSLTDPDSLNVRGELKAGVDCTIDTNVVIEGKVRLGENVTIGSGCVLKDVHIADNVRIYAQSYLEGATVGEDCEIGPSARLRPGTILQHEVRVGNFVEIKNATLEQGVKAGHLAYIGDAYVGAFTNIGAGAITCNFDGVQKNRTVIGKHVFIGTNCSLVAPIHIADGAFVAAGTTVNKTHVEEGQLVVGRPDLRVIPNWKERSRRPKPDPS